jgi:hypothetical protein
MDREKQMLPFVRRFGKALFSRRSLITAAMVGTVLNLINQWDGLLAPSTLSMPQAALTYLVPLLVVSFGVASAAEGG